MRTLEFDQAMVLSGADVMWFGREKKQPHAVEVLVEGTSPGHWFVYTLLEAIDAHGAQGADGDTAGVRVSEDAPGQG